MRADQLTAYRKDQICIQDHRNGTLYPILKFTGDPHDTIDGKVVHISDTELKMTDAYEGKSYIRRPVQLVSGVIAWCYIAPID